MDHFWTTKKKKKKKIINKNIFLLDLLLKMANNRLICLEDFEREASKKLDRNAWVYYSSGAMMEHTVKDNVLAYDRLGIVLGYFLYGPSYGQISFHYPGISFVLVFFVMSLVLTCPLLFLVIGYHSLLEYHQQHFTAWLILMEKMLRLEVL